MKWYSCKGAKHAPSLMHLAKHDMPSGIGRKGNKVVKKKPRSKATLTDENRIPLRLESRGTGGNIQTITNGNQSCLQTQYNVCVDTCMPSHQQSLQLPVSDSMSHFAQSIQPSMGGAPLQPVSPFAFNVPLNFSQYKTPPFYQSPYGTCLRMPLYQQQQQDYMAQNNYPQQNVSQRPFFVWFRNGRITVCNGCREHYEQFDDIVIQHEEYRSFTNPQTGLPAKKMGNTYYHCRLQCVLLKWPGFHAQMLVIGDEVKERLTDLQKTILHNEFGFLFD